MKSRFTNEEGGYGGPSGPAARSQIPHSLGCATFLSISGAQMGGYELRKMGFLFHVIVFRRTTMSSAKERDSQRLRAGSSARGAAEGIGDIRSGGLSLFLLCAGANRI